MTVTHLARHLTVIDNPVRASDAVTADVTNSLSMVADAMKLTAAARAKGAPQ